MEKVQGAKVGHPPAGNATSASRRSRPPEIGRRIRRRVDHTPAIVSIVRNLQDPTALAHELLQNANDAVGATEVTFTFTDEALEVHDNGGFRRCADIYAEDCVAWDASTGRERCDFHGLQFVAGRSKADDIDSTGAFGIGMLAVYRVTDRPEVISARRHWLIDDLRGSEDRIGECKRCGRNHDEPGTTVILPWATHSRGVARQRLGVDAMTIPRRRRLFEDVRVALPAAMLFLRCIQIVHLRGYGQVVTFERQETARDRVAVAGDGEQRAFRIFVGEVAEAAQLKRDFGRVVAGRSTAVRIAVELDERVVDGALHATLPTDERLPYPLRVDGSFFPLLQRRNLDWSQEVEGRWNRAVLRGAARLLAANVEAVAGEISQQRLWRMVRDMHEAPHSQSAAMPPLQVFWEELAPHVRTAAVLCDEVGQPRRPVDSHTLQMPVDAAARRAVRELGFALVPVRVSKTIGRGLCRTLEIPELDLNGVARALSGLSLRNGATTRDLPKVLRAKSNREGLWRVAGRLQQSSGLETSPLTDVAWLPCLDGRLRSRRQLVVVEHRDLDLVRRIDATIADVGAMPDDARTLLSAPLNLEGLVGLLEQAGHRLGGVHADRALRRGEVLAWLARRCDGQAIDAELRERIVALPIFPVRGSVQPGRNLRQPGGFRDPLYLSGVLDSDAVRGAQEFISRVLEISTLTFERYVELLEAKASFDEFNDEALWALLRLCDRQVGELADANATVLQRRLGALEVVPCDDGQRRAATAIYVTADVRRVIDDVAVAALPAEGGGRMRPLLVDLGAAAAPRDEDLLVHVQRLAAHAVPERIAIERVLGFLVDVPAARLKSIAGALAEVAWLQAEGEGERGFRARDLVLSEARPLAGAHARYIDLGGMRRKRQLRGVLRELGVAHEPPVEAVVAHLRAAAHAGASLGKTAAAVYGYLDRHAATPEVAALLNERCVEVARGRYVAPGQVFLRADAFVPYLASLPVKLASLKRLTTVWEIAGQPGVDEVIGVMLKVAANAEQRHPRPVSKDYARVMRACWQHIAHQTLETSQKERLAGRRVVRGSSNTLLRTDEALLIDKPELARAFGEAITAWLIPSREDRHLLKSLGLRSLSQASTARALRIGPDVPVDLSLRLRERLELVLRLVADADRGGLRRLLAFMEDAPQLRCVGWLVVEHRVEVADQVIVAAQPARAFHDRDAATLYVALHAGHADWLGLAGELREVACPLAGRQLSLTIATILAQDDVRASRQQLDQVLDPIADEDLAAYRDFLASSYQDGSDVTDDVTAAVNGHGAHTRLPKASSGDVARTERVVSTEAIDAAHGDSGSPPRGRRPVTYPERYTGPGVPPPNGGAQRDQAAGEQAGPTAPVASSGPQPGLTGRALPHGGDWETSATTGAAGVRHVLEQLDAAHVKYEHMKHNNTGYDIALFDEHGKLCTVVEVKSTAGRWENPGPTMSLPQATEASKQGTAFALLIVEHALDPHRARIWSLSDPLGKTARIQFGAQWRKHAVQLTFEKLAQLPTR